MITRIYIRNFRSIGEIDIDCENINTFIGKNDAGKSNIVKALNLFFNNETDLREKFDFDRDFCHFHQTPQKKAKEIIVEITVKVPDSYNTGNNKTREVIWGKSWRQNSQNPHDSWVLLNLRNRPILSPRSRIPAWLNKIRFHYIPAIKDQTFFSYLMGELYDVLATKSKTQIRGSADKFKKSVQIEAKDLLSELAKMFNMDSEISLPEDLRKIYEDLEFYLNGVPLNRRGDGIKMRHIPEILYFMGNKANASLSRGGVLQENIWGFEEPENCIEIGASYDMQKKFINYAKQNYQIFLTTHSPVFYRIESKNIICKNYFVHKKQTTKGEYSNVQEIPDAFEIDKKMENAFLSPKDIDSIYSGIKQLGEDKEKLNKEIQKTKNNIIFVEGKSDVKIIEHALKLWYPKEVNRIDIQPKSHNGGADKIATLVESWASMRHDDTIKAFVIFDSDKKDVASKLRNKLHKKTNTIKVIELTSNKINNIRKVFPNIVTDLEAMYSDEIWNHAEKQNWIEQKKQQETISQISLAEQKRLTNIFSPQQPLFNDLPSIRSLSDSDKLRVFCKWGNGHKLLVADYVIGLSEYEAKQALAELRPIIDDIINHFKK